MARILAAETMTKFIDSYATDELLPPWKSEQSTCWCFIVPIPEEGIVRYLGSYFNDNYPDPAPYTYSPLRLHKQYGLIIVCEQQVIISSAKPERPDRLGHTEVYLAIPVNRSRRDRPTVNPPVVWVQPFAFGNNSYVMFGSREVWGMDMIHANIDLDRAGADGLKLDLSINGIERFSPRSEASMIPCMHIAAGEKSTAGPSANADLDALVREVGDGGFIFGPAPLEIVSPSHKSTPAERPVELNNVKQFRDVYDMNTAVYRAIVASHTTHKAPSQPISFNLAQVEVEFIWSDSIKEMVSTLFGIDPPTSQRAPGRAQLPVELAYSFQSTVDFKVLKTLHTYAPIQTP
jgi:hypothetical protein